MGNSVHGREAAKKRELCGKPCLLQTLRVRTRYLPRKRQQAHLSDGRIRA
ncbi:hypothetical protein HMPREF9120_00866 [Neisseria sp. oral taxon 020 str. F0370]|nr:hypothetical protein HMPREF9120_00866 [Neisseria sp. oral taxon 020 str. F0370]